MAQRTVVVFEDDLDAGEAAGTVRFAPRRGRLRDRPAGAERGGLRAAFDIYVEVVRRPRSHRAAKTAGAARSHAGGATRTDPAQLAAVRDWARSRGLEVKARGRFSRDMLAQYNVDMTAAQRRRSAAIRKPRMVYPPVSR